MPSVRVDPLSRQRHDLCMDEDGVGNDKQKRANNVFHIFLNNLRRSRNHSKEPGAAASNELAPPNIGGAKSIFSMVYVFRLEDQPDTKLDVTRIGSRIRTAE